MAGLQPHYSSLLRARRGYLATVGSDATPHLVPVCFTWAGDVIWTAVDAKPKSTQSLQRLKDIESNSSISFVVDRWDEDWSRLAWLQARGKASKLAPGPETDRAYAALKDKYTQYKEYALEGPVIRIDVERWVGWSADEE